MRTQIIAQAPPEAVGLSTRASHRGPFIPPSFAPRRRSETSLAFYSLLRFSIPMIGGSAMVAGIELSGSIPKGNRCGLPTVVPFLDSTSSLALVNLSSLPIPLQRQVRHRPKQNRRLLQKQLPNRVPKQHRTQRKTAPDMSQTTVEHETPIRVTESSSEAKAAAVTRVPRSNIHTARVTSICIRH